MVLSTSETPVDVRHNFLLNGYSSRVPLSPFFNFFFQTPKKVYTLNMNYPIVFNAEETKKHFIIPSSHSDNNGIDPPYFDVSGCVVNCTMTANFSLVLYTGHCCWWYRWFFSGLFNAQVKRNPTRSKIETYPFPPRV